MFKKRIPKSVIRVDEIESKEIFGLNLNENTVACDCCGSYLCYIKTNLGVVAEDDDYGIIGNRGNRTYNVREIGLTIYCAECGEYIESYSSFSYDRDKVVCTWDELGDSEKAEIDYCLSQWDQKGDFKPQWKCSEVNVLKEKLKEYEKKHPIKNENKKNKRRK